MLGNLSTRKVIGVCLVMCFSNLWTTSLVIPRRYRMHTLAPLDVHHTFKINPTKLPTPKVPEISNITKKDHISKPTPDQRFRDATSLDTILRDKTNTRKVYLASKLNNFYLKMSKSGHLSGTHNIHDREAIFIIETMTRGVVRIKNEVAGRYICINQNGKIVTRVKPIHKCYLHQYFEENYYHIFWSHKYSKVRDGESGWLLALKENGKMKRPSRTKLGDNSTFFFIQDARSLWLG